MFVEFVVIGQNRFNQLKISPILSVSYMVEICLFYVSVLRAISILMLPAHYRKTYKYLTYNL